MAKKDSPHSFSGDVFKSAREGKGLTIETVHEITKIPMDVLKAIEEGYTVRNISSFYMQGFRKMYAKYLGLDVGTEPPKPPASPAQPIPTKPPAPPVRPRALKPEAAALASKRTAPSHREEFPDRFEAMLSRERQRQLIQIVGVLILVFFMFKIGGCLFKGQPREKKPAVQKKAETKAEKKAPAARKKRARKKINPKTAKTAKPATAQVVSAAVEPAIVLNPPPENLPPPAQAAEPAAPVFTKPVNLTVKAGKSGWLQVKVDGVLVFQSTLKSGSSETWQAEEMIELSGKNIHNLEFELNGKMIGGLGRADRSARKVVVTKNGLSVKM